MLSELLWSSIQALTLGALICVFVKGYSKTAMIVFSVSVTNVLAEDYIKLMSNSANLTAFEIVTITDALTAYCIYLYGDYGKLILPCILALFVLTHSFYLLSYQLDVFDDYSWYSIAIITLNMLQLWCFRKGLHDAYTKLADRDIVNLNSYRYNNTSTSES